MMMPANYSAISAEEMTYVNGGEVDFAAMGAQLFDNAKTIVANTYVSKLVAATLGVLFGGSYKFGGVFGAVGDIVTGNDTYNFVNSALQVVGLVAAVDQLATNDVPAYTKNKKFIDVG